MSEEKVFHPAQVELARIFSSVLLLGPPMNDKLVRLVAHLFTPEEAVLARALPYYYPRPLLKIAAKLKRDPDEIRPVLDSMAARRTIYGGEKGYSLLPLIPGMFEYLLMRGDDDEWYREYARLLIDVYSSGYTREYIGPSSPAIRNIPVQSVVETKNQVLDSELVSEMIEAHDRFAILNVCQCRQSTRFTEKECRRARPEDGCLVFGSFAESTAERGNGVQVDREKMKDVADERWEKGLVFMTANVSPSSPNAICTCCDCCCHFLEAVNHYGGKPLMARPRFLAKVDETKCNLCGKCVKACNTHAHQIKDKKHEYDPQKCIGCGACVPVCKQKAIELADNPDYQAPSKSFATLGVRLAPSIALSGLKVRLKR